LIISLELSKSQFVLKERKAEIAPHQVPLERVGFVDETSNFVVGQPREEVEFCSLLSKQATSFPKASLSMPTALVNILSYLTS
jgi:hypothetical protein